MPSAEARIETDRASRYLVQLCSHASRMGHRLPSRMSADWSDTEGTIQVDGGTCTLTSTDDTLTVHVNASGTDELRRIQDAITRDLTRFSRRDPLTVDWTPVDEDAVPAPTVHKQHKRNRSILVAAAVLAIAAHVVAAVLSAPHWTSLAVDVVLVAVVVKAVVIGGHLTLRRRAKRTSEHQA